MQIERTRNMVAIVDAEDAAALQYFGACAALNFPME